MANSRNPHLSIKALIRFSNSEVVRTSLMKGGITPAPGTAAQANTLIELEWSRWGKIAKDAKINLD